MESKLNLNTLSFKQIKEYGSNISLNDRESMLKFSEMLKSDLRKNVQNLGNSLQKKLSSYTKELKRISSMYAFDKSFGDYNFVAGIDEVGRGPLAGPIVSSAVIFDLKNITEKDMIPGINDSKKLSAKKREELAQKIMNNCVSYSIALVDNKLIDIKGIGWCNNEVFKMACNKLKVRPDLVLSDGYPIKDFDIENKAVIKGDCKSISIAAASIVAKVYRDNLMKQYSEKYSGYGFENNVGYGTKEHITAIQKLGITEIHRKSFLKNIEAAADATY